MALTKLYQIIDTKDQKVWLTKRTQEECEQYLTSGFPPDYMSSVFLTVQPVWTNASDKQLKKLLEE